MNPPAGLNLSEKEGSLNVRMKGLEPPRLTAPDPKSGAAANYATSALPFFKGGSEPPAFVICNVSLGLTIALHQQIPCLN